MKTEGNLSQRRLKVLFITEWYPTAKHPVKGAFVQAHARAVQLHDDVVVLHCAGKDPDLRSAWRIEEETGSITTFRIWRRRGPLPGISSIAYVQGVLGAYRQIASGGFYPDIVHAHVYEAGVPAVLIGRRERLPVVITEHSSDFVRRRLPPWQVWKARFAFRRADCVLPVSRVLQRAIEGHGVSARFTVVPNAVDTDLFHPWPTPRVGSHPKRLLFVGPLIPAKGLGDLLRALPRDESAGRSLAGSGGAEPGGDRGWHLDVVGEDLRRQAEYERLASELGVAGHVTFHGRLSRPEIARLMQAADLFVLPSLVETFSVVTVEALASGLPVLATRCGGPEEYLTPDLGMLVPPGDVDALRHGLAAMLSQLDRFSTERCSAFAREHFSQQVVGAQLHAIYESCLARSARQGATAPGRPT